MKILPFILCLLLAAPLFGDEQEIFGKSIQPMLKEYCLNCHSTEKQKGELDLERFSSLDLVKGDPAVWGHSLDQILDGEMPPKDKPQPSPGNLKLLTDWIQGTLDDIALANAGDPGPVVLRRLSNHEYTYTLRDLTGVDSLDPAREFPIDGAAGEGFTNVGAALVMSPALLTKYLDAAKEVANHLVLLPDGVRFSASDSSQDWTDETLTRIRAIYAKHTVTGKGDRTKQQGIDLELGTDGGRLPLTAYLDAAQGKGAAEGLSPKYLAILTESLKGDSPSPLLDPLRAKFREKTLTAAEIEPWQNTLWRFATVGHIGKENGPKSWQEPVAPLVASHEMRVKLEDKRDTTLYLTTTDAGDGAEGDDVIWEGARLVAPGRPDLPVHALPDLVAHLEKERSRIIESCERLLAAIAAGDDDPDKDLLLAPAMRSFRSQEPDKPILAKAPSVVEIAIPAALAAGAEFVVTGRLATKETGSVQMRVLAEKPDPRPGLIAGNTETGIKGGQWSDNNLVTRHRLPVIANPASESWKRFETAFDEFRSLFPIALCYSKIVPVDEIVTLTLFHREDTHLKRLILDETQTRELDRLWDELLFVSEAPLKQVDVFEQLFQYATQDAKPSAFEPMREPILATAAKFKQEKIDADAAQREAVIAFAAKAWRRTLTESEKTSLRAFAPRLMVARVLTSPAFLYRGEQAPETTGPVSDWELATRLSYFLTSSAPDDELRALAAAGRLSDDTVLATQARRLLKTKEIRRLATEFGCQYLHVRDVATLDEKSERHFPEFTGLRDDMQEEVTRFFIDLFQNDGSVLSLLDSDHTFVNGPLAAFYGMENPQSDIRNPTSPEWHRIDGLREHGRGGILGFAATLAKHSGASRTSAILRGTWVSEVVLGDKLPNPPRDVPILPDEAPEGLTERQLIERHSRDANCAGCHSRIDPYGFALEGFDAIGRAREADTKTVLRDGTPIAGLEELRDYLAGERREDFLGQFCRKLLGYALGRSVQLSDQPLLDELVAIEGNRIGDLVEHIVLSPQFRNGRGRELVVK